MQDRLVLNLHTIVKKFNVFILQQVITFCQQILVLRAQWNSPGETFNVKKITLLLTICNKFIAKTERFWFQEIEYEMKCNEFNWL